MKKDEFIKKYGQEAWKRMLKQGREWRKNNREKNRAASRNWKLKNPEKVKAHQRDQNRKGGRHYDKKLERERTGVQGAKQRIRANHTKKWKKYKNIIAPDSQIHHEWIPQTADYRGVALVEANPHQYGIIDVILILDGKITLLTEDEVKNGGGLR